MTRHIANVLTVCRVTGSVLLLFLPVFSSAFYITYLICGLSDMIDGTVARKTNSVSDLGAKMDTAADLVFVAVCFIKLLPTISMPWLLWIWGGIIAMIKICHIIWGLVFKKQFISPHTMMNKITGLLLFMFPWMISFAGWEYFAIVVCSVATFSAIQEGFYIATEDKNK